MSVMNLVCRIGIGVADLLCTSWNDSTGTQKTGHFSKQPVLAEQRIYICYDRDTGRSICRDAHECTSGPLLSVAINVACTHSENENSIFA
jgi:hypothetical protein